MSRPDHHLAFHQALAARLDQPLDPRAEASLQAHLATCGPCRSVAQAYDAQRKALRDLRQPEPPRDLWARTATALDHEVGRRSGAPRLVALGSLASLGLVLAVVLGATGLGPFNVTRPGSATPFPVTPQPVAYLTTDGNQITIYQTQVSAVCPTSAPDCTDPGPSARPVAHVALDAALSPRDLALAADGNLAITARDSQGRANYSVVTLPGSEATETASPLASARSTSSRRPGTAEPTASLPSAVASGAAGPSVSPPRRTRAMPRSSCSSATSSPPVRPRPGRRTAPSWPSAPVRPMAARGPTSTSGASALRPRRPSRRTITPTSPRGTASGSSSAGRRRPPRRPGTPRRIRPAATTRPPARRPGPPRRRRRPSVVATTMLLDPATGAAQRVALDDAWLPAVDPTGHLVVFWSGTLRAHGPTVDLTAGSLFIADWSAATGIAPVVTPPPSQAAASSSPGADATTPDVSPSASPSASPDQASPTPPLTGPTRGPPHAAAERARPAARPVPRSFPRRRPGRTCRPP